MTMNPAHNAFNHIVAFDVGKESLAVCILPGDERHSIANKPKAIRKLLMAQMRRNANLSLGPLLVVCEATGGYERPLLEICIELGLPAHKAHGSRVRHFAKYLGLIAKTDPIDARALALYGLQTEGLRLYVPLTPELAALAALKARRDQYPSHAACRNQPARACPPPKREPQPQGAYRKLAQIPGGS